MGDSPRKIITPGAQLFEELRVRDWSQQVLAEILGRPDQVVSEIINDKKEITRETAAQLAAALNTTPEFWLQLQNTYRLDQMDQDVTLQKKLAEISKRAQTLTSLKEDSMAKEQRLVVTCDRHGGVIDETTGFLHVEVTPGKTKRGRKTKQELDLCEGCAQDFLKFMEGKADG